MNKLLFTILTLGLFLTSARAQGPQGTQPKQEVTITGKVIDENGNGVGSAEITILELPPETLQDRQPFSTK